MQNSVGVRLLLLLQFFFFIREKVVAIMFVIFSLFRECKNTFVMRVVSSTLQYEGKKDTEAGWSGTKVCDALVCDTRQLCSPGCLVGPLPFSERRWRLPGSPCTSVQTHFCLSFPRSSWVCGSRTASNWAIRCSPQQVVCATILQGPLFMRVAEAPTFSWLASCSLMCFGGSWLWPAQSRSLHFCASCCLVPCWVQPPLGAAAPQPRGRSHPPHGCDAGPYCRALSGPAASPGIGGYSFSFPSYALTAAIRLKPKCCTFQKTHFSPQSSRMALSALARSSQSLLLPLTPPPEVTLRGHGLYVFPRTDVPCSPLCLEKGQQSPWRRRLVTGAERLH